MSNTQTAQTLLQAADGSRLIVALVALALLVATPVLRADVHASLDRDAIYTGDTVTLSVETDGDDQGREPELAPLRKDFDILGTSSNQQIQIINGQRSDMHQWLVELAPRRTGTLTVPALKVGDSHTAALTLKVSEQPAVSGGAAGQPVFIESEIMPAATDTYVQQQILYTTRLYYRVPLIEGDFSDPALDNAAVERLGEDHQYQTTRDGQHYQVLERRYAIFPEHSGKLTIPPSVFTGRMVSASGQRSPFDRMDAMMERMLGKNPFKDSFFAGTPFADPGKRVRLRGNPLSLDVKARPTTYRGDNWLPTPKLVLHDSWADSPPEFRAGEPVTRTITIEAKGLEAAQLPDIHIPHTDGLRVYPEKPVQTNRTDGDWVYGQSKQTFAYMATAPGKIDLPKIQVDWWDTGAQKERTAVLPQWEVVAEAGNDASATATRTPPAGPGNNPSVTPAPATSAAANSAVSDAGHGPAAQTPAKLWLVVGGLALLAVLFTVLLARKARGRASSTAAEVATAKPDSRQAAGVAATAARERLRRACAENNPQAAAGALLELAKTTWRQHPPRSLGDLAARLDRGDALVRELEVALYAPGGHAWVGQPLWQAFADGFPSQTRAAAGRTTPVGGAPSLYPDWTHTTG